MTVDGATRSLVRRRAGDCCEYCGLPQADSPLTRLHIEHIRPLKHGGTDAPDNLALACIDCNLHKGSDIAGLDPKTDQLTELFHPRLHEWDDHFKWDGVQVLGTTPVWRTTVAVLQLNAAERIDLRNVLAEE